ncbi:zinc finger protein weckle [Drosophila miranda]|uniref:zinc finger protein weckle n=1 Tax=Drosophila miranda TaxID=7229 RepID=UPI0007E77BE5|nr:zinc finger protein weckle [Drosophila miranda]
MAAAPLSGHEASATDWHLWCRLCAKDDLHGNINVFLKHEHTGGPGDGPASDLALATAIGKYFWVDITRSEELPKMICSDCLTLVTTLVNFSERITRVQKLYCILQTTAKQDHVNLQELRSKFGLLEEEPETLTEVHYVEEKPKLGAQGDLLIEESTFDMKNPLNETVDDKEEELEAATSRSEENEPDSDQEIDEEEEEEQEQEYEEVDENAVLLKLCDAYGITEDNSSRDSHKCPRRTPTKQSKSKEDPDKAHQCTICSRAYARASTLNRHMRQDHDRIYESNLLACQECPKKFRTRYQLERHSQGHLPMPKRKVFPCASCDKMFASNASALQHAQYQHLDERPRPVICEQCGVRVTSISNLKVHVLTHTDHAPFECDVCKKCFKSASRLKHHKETHDPHKYICPECGMQLNSRTTLNRHRLVHTDQMQHKCDYCGREFKRAKALKNHLILHTGLKPYSCDFCDRTFANGSNCRTHKKKSHPEELAAQEAAGGAKTCNRNIPKLEALKAFTKNKDNLSPVATKQSGCFAFGKKPKPQIKEDVSPPAAEPVVAAEAETETESEVKPPTTAIPTIDTIYNHIMIDYH